MRNTIHHYGRIIITSLMMLVGAIELFEIFGNLSTQWYWLLIATTYTVVVNDVFCHRICSHGMFPINTNSKVYKVFVWLASTDMGYGPVKWITLSHNLHHIYSDHGPVDVMNWRYHWYSTTIVSPIPRADVKPADYREYLIRQRRKHEDILNDRWTNFCTMYYIEISILTFAILFLVLPIVLFKVVCVGRLILSLLTGLAGIIGHIKNVPTSYRNFDTSDTTSNSMILHVLFLGLFSGMLQNNHHGQPKSERPNPRWFEFDTSWPFVKLLRICMEKK